MFKKLYIKLLSIAFLVTLTCYSGNENIILPQQFTSEYVVFTNVDNGTASYSTASSTFENLTSEFIAHSVQAYFISVNSSQNVVFKINYFKGQGLKEKRQVIAFQTEMSSHSEIVNRLFI